MFEDKSFKMISHHSVKNATKHYIPEKCNAEIKC